MDTNKWKSVLVPRTTYDEIKALAESQGRKIGGQLKLVFEFYKENCPEDFRRLKNLQ